MKNFFILTALALGACAGNDLTRAPDWYLEPPSDKQKIYASGYGNDVNLQFAIEISELSAKRTLASQISSTVNGRSKYYRGANGKNLSEIGAIETIDAVNLSGYERERIKIKEDDGNYVVYVLLVYNLSNMSNEPSIFKDMD
ncbi:MAG: hypothetical protein CMB80_01705 [Flammeovirgaceae bacterium]|nr:hypothetical protein [Flammeovirgaceae bacterium]